MRLIDADALMKEGWVLHKEVVRMGGYAVHEMPLSCPSLPTIDAVPVVRCRECNMADDDRNSGKTYFWCLHHSCFVTKDDFCSYGQRREDGDA